MFPTDLCQVTSIIPISSDPRLQRGFAQIIHQLISTRSCIMSRWARSAYSFEAFIKKCVRFFRNKRIEWKINDTVLQFILPRFEKKRFVPVLIDPSFIENRVVGSPTKTKQDQKEAKKGFFLLSAALPVRGRAISFFQMIWRNTQISYMVHKSLNELLGLQLLKIRNLLSAVISKAVFIMDRGFGYEFFIRKCVELDVNYVIRIRDLNTHVIMARNKKEYPLAELAARVKTEPILFKIFYKGILYTNVVISRKGNQVWALATNLDDTKAVIDLYSQRMKIEEAFKDWKSTGFDIEKLQIRQWDVLPKMIWCVVIAHMILYLLGEVINRSKQYRNLFKRFIQKKHNLSCVQLAWNAWQFALHDILPLFQTLKSYLSALTEVYL